MKITERKRNDSILNRADTDSAQTKQYQEQDLRSLTEDEIRIVAGGPEVDVSAGGG
ncbi:hypothetical protein UNDYM_0072 [Undibacterium sp. YM2]|uniref:hypothetical protein n=1 Tax=Undibacterium sp. YM2 TaxID=2058625 RepID=UPI001331D43D|nr:hypothetical protein [Undibacterium sp. YM2]BBB64325.1 hypothetical protein UNDYM_0072 [Undibacterium sp. YM2]